MSEQAATPVTLLVPSADETCKEKEEPATVEAPVAGSILSNPQFWMLVAMNLAQNGPAEAKPTAVASACEADAADNRVKSEATLEQKAACNQASLSAGKTAAASRRWATAHVSTAWMIWYHQQAQKQMSGPNASGTVHEPPGCSRKKEPLARDYPRPRIRGSRNSHKDALNTFGNIQQMAMSGMSNASLNDQLMMMVAKANSRTQPAYHFLESAPNFASSAACALPGMGSRQGQTQTPNMNYLEMAKLLNMAGLLRFST